MPELPEVETTIKGLHPLIGLKVRKVNILTKKIRYIVPEGINKIQEKSRISNIKRISKYILISFSNNFSVIFHLGMSGRLKILDNYKSKEKHDHIVINFQNSKFLIFNDPRRFGFIDFDKTSLIHTRKYLSILGIDALSNDLTLQYLLGKINKSKVPIKQIILNQKIIAGIGKSGIVGRKIVATLNSTGTRSLFLHPVEAMHGDLGIVSKDDIFIALSNAFYTK